MFVYPQKQALRYDWHPQTHLQNHIFIGMCDLRPLHVEGMCLRVFLYVQQLGIACMGEQTNAACLQGKVNNFHAIALPGMDGNWPNYQL